ncbi:MAG: protein-L-isoaspartate(D-aspartate) O-methyltransferase [Bacteroidales bacterium]|nr:protein-L-isoaspartate(D-aspartate) O-methyltransferase [Bacteroidales bacterium]
MSDCTAQQFPEDGYEDLRKSMVREQIQRRGVRDARVLEAMKKVKRHLFVPAEMRHLAYEDHPLPIGEDQTISQPYIVALMTELLEPEKGARVLEIGTGSGYQAAVLAEVFDSVYTIEIFESLGRNAELLLEEQRYRNVKVKIGDGYQGWKEYSPFDGIIVTCSPTHVPEALKEQLAEGGRMVIPIGEKYTQELVVLTKEKGMFIQKEVIAVRFVPMIDQKGQSY